MTVAALTCTPLATEMLQKCQPLVYAHMHSTSDVNEGQKGVRGVKVRNIVKAGH